MKRMFINVRTVVNVHTKVSVSKTITAILIQKIELKHYTLPKHSLRNEKKIWKESYLMKEHYIE